MLSQVNITLSETDTIWMLDIPSTCVALDSSEAEEVKKQIEVYQEVSVYIQVCCIQQVPISISRCVQWPLKSIFRLGVG